MMQWLALITNVDTNLSSACPVKRHEAIVMEMREGSKLDGIHLLEVLTLYSPLLLTNVLLLLFFYSRRKIVESGEERHTEILFKNRRILFSGPVYYDVLASSF